MVYGVTKLSQLRKALKPLLDMEGEALGSAFVFLHVISLSLVYPQVKADVLTKRNHESPAASPFCFYTMPWKSVRI